MSPFAITIPASFYAGGSTPSKYEAVLGVSDDPYVFGGKHGSYDHVSVAMAFATMTTGNLVSDADKRTGSALRKIWWGTKNETLWPDHRAIKLPFDIFPRLQATTTALVEDVMSQGKAREDITACVAGHGFYYATIKYLLDSGVRVVSRETNSYHLHLITVFGAAYASGQLLVSDYEKDRHSSDYDIVVWEHPQPTSPRTEATVRLPDLYERLVAGGLLMIQSDGPREFVYPFLRNLNYWTPLLVMPINEDDYMLPSMSVGAGHNSLGNLGLPGIAAALRRLL